MPAPPLLVDGHNLLMHLARRDGAGELLLDLRAGERELAELLAIWSTLRAQPVILIWDGRGPVPPVEGIRQVRVSPPAEADDFLVHEAHRLRHAGSRAVVVTRDRELHGRLPSGTGRLDVDQLARDLAALSAAPLRAPHVAGPATQRTEPLAPAPGPQFPRRRDAAPHDGPPKGPELGAPDVGSASQRPTVPPQAAAALDAQRREAARARKQQARQRFERAQRRKRPRQTR